MLAAKLEGKVFDMLTVLSRSGSNKSGSAMWLCACTCGTEVRVRTADLRNGNTGSCGCRNPITAKVGVTHGEGRTRLYNVWSNMMRRCNNPNSTHFSYYGGRGIKVCRAWHKYEVFRDWARANGYTGELTLDKTDNDRNYSPMNCRWIPRHEQAANQRSNISVDYKGENVTLTEACRRANMPYSVVRDRIKKLKWNFERAMDTPVQKRTERLI